MRRHLSLLRFVAFVFLLGSAVPASAKMVTINDITIDVPSGFTASDTDRGIEAKTPDEEAFLWFETYKGNESDALIAEHAKYWDEQKVVGGDPEKSTGKLNDADFTKQDYVHATWKGEPTVLRYFQIGPLGPQDEYVLVTLWASPDADKTHAAEIKKMFDSLSVKIAK